MTVDEALVQLHDMAVNEYPDDVEAVAVVRREIERLRAVLATYGDHTAGCWYEPIIGRDSECDCGWREIEAEVWDDG